MCRVFDYNSDETFNLECKKLFDEYYHFGAHISELQNESDFYRIDAAGRNIVLWNDSGTIKAFENCCPHRGCRIIDKEEGCGKMICPYHGWTFHSGKVAIPSKNDFNQSDIENISLKYYSVEQCGNFIFFSPSPKQSLKDQLGDFYNDVEKMSYSINSRVDKNPQSFDSNWKIGVENAIESYHVQMIHPESLQILNLDTNKIQYEKFNSFLFAPIQNEKVNKKLMKVKELFEGRYEYDGYFSLYIFPFSMISSTYGYSYGIQTFLPNSPIKVDFMSRTYSVTSNLDGFFDGVSSLNHQIFLEDATVCNLVQKGFSRAKKDINFIYADNAEQRIRYFHNNYNEVIV
jgi:phenylpropionate dioxygenase-like ring-hydroxylating dioxygenase large terminal subunit